jgi:uncharacterized protein (TIGR03067 family)
MTGGPVTPLLIGIALTLGAPGLKDKPAAHDLYGEWEFVSAVDGGKPDPVTSPPYRYRFNRDGTWQVFRGDAETAGRRGFKFDPKADPPTLDTNTPPAGPESPLVLGIYRVEGDRLTLCKAFPGKPRPTAFAAPPQSECYLVVLRRVTAKD